jgi:dTDP-4-dehydrorhamnose 3,5-epimerase-like enzyme
MVEIIPLDKIGEHDRGATFVFDNQRTGQYIVAYRKAGSANGRHYHKGLHAYKRPEKLILMQGEAVLNWRNMQGEEQGSLTVKAPAIMIIPEMIWHEVIATTDFVMLELNGLDAGKDDTFTL